MIRLNSGMVTWVFGCYSFLPNIIILDQMSQLYSHQTTKPFSKSSQIFYCSFSQLFNPITVVTGPLDTSSTIALPKHCTWLWWILLLPSFFLANNFILKLQIQFLSLHDSRTSLICHFSCETFIVQAYTSSPCSTYFVKLLEILVQISLITHLMSITGYPILIGLHLIFQLSKKWNNHFRGWLNTI